MPKYLSDLTFKCCECGNYLEVEDIDECEEVIYIRPCDVCIKKDECCQTGGKTWIKM